jgi:hypothetical protein
VSLLLVKKEKDEAKTLTGAHGTGSAGVFEPGRESVTALFNIKKHKGPRIVGDLVGLDNKIPS